MSRRKLIVLLFVVMLAVSLVATPALAQEGEGGEEGEESGIEGTVGGFVEAQGLLGAVIIFALGVILLTFFVEKLISYLIRASLELQVSLFAFAIVFTGFEFDDTVLGLVLAAGGLEGAALGTALGTGLAIIGVTLALAAIVRPFPIDLPSDYIAIFALAPLVLIPFALLGTLTLIPGLVLVGFFVLAFAYFIIREYQRDVPVFRSTELGEAIRSGSDSEPRTDGGTQPRTDGGTALPGPVSQIPEDRLVGNRSGWIWVGFSILALIGIVLASILLETSSEVVIEGFGISGTVFGATILTAILTFEDIVLTLEPVRRGVPEIGAGNVIGSVLFSVTGNIGILTLVSEVTIGSSVLIFHLPFIIVITLLAAYFMYQGKLKRWHGYLLSGLYIAYWVIAFTAFGGAPVGG